MVTIPARLAHRAVVSANLAEAQARSRALYRDYYRSAPEICSLYALDVPPSTMRAKIRQKFEVNKNLKDIAVLDLLLHKGRLDYQETMNAWKQIPHIMKWFAEEEAARESGETSSSLSKRIFTNISFWILLAPFLSMLCSPTGNVPGEVLCVKRRRQGKCPDRQLESCFHGPLALQIQLLLYISDVC